MLEFCLFFNSNNSGSDKNRKDVGGEVSTLSHSIGSP